MARLNSTRSTASARMFRSDGTAAGTVESQRTSVHHADRRGADHAQRFQRRQPIRHPLDQCERRYVPFGIRTDRADIRAKTLALAAAAGRPRASATSTATARPTSSGASPAATLRSGIQTARADLQARTLERPAAAGKSPGSAISTATARPTSSGVPRRRYFAVEVERLGRLRGTGPWNHRQRLEGRWGWRFQWRRRGGHPLEQRKRRHVDLEFERRWRLHSQRPRNRGPWLASRRGRHDFNGDNEADILWSNASGDAAIWNSNGSGGFTPQDLGTAGSGWQVAGVGDFNGDGAADILWSNASGDTAIWNSNSSGGFVGQ